MQIDRINNFHLIEKCLKRNSPELFYILPNGHKAMAPIERRKLASILDPCYICNPYITNCMDVIKRLFNITPIPDKNYEYYEIFQGLNIWILCCRRFNDDVSIIGVSEAI